MAENSTLNATISRSFKWSFIAQICAKLTTPISTMVLARILAPEIFGITTAVTMVISLCEIIADSGFGKYLIQHDFDTEDEYERCFSVAAYASVALSAILCVLIVVLSSPISSLISNEGYESVLMLSTIQIPVFALNSVYLSDLRRAFKFNKIFFASIASILSPFIVTVPLALLGFSYWSLVIGSLVSIVAQTALLIVFSKRKLRLFFSFHLLKQMFGFSFAMIVEAILIWLCQWAAVFIVGKYYSQYDVGLFKVTVSTITSIFGILSATITSVLFPSFSRLKDDDVGFKEIFVKSQKVTMCIAIPLGIGSYLFAPLITAILLGSKWTDASFGIGLVGMAFALKCCYPYFLSEVFRSKGNYYHSILFQVLMLIIQVTLCATLGKISYSWFVVSYALSNVFYVLVSILYLIFKYGFGLKELIKPLAPPLLSSLFMMLLYLPAMNVHSDYLSQFVLISIMGIGYFSFMALFFNSCFNEVVSFILRK